MRMHIVVVNGNYVMNGEPISVNCALQVHPKRLDRDGFSVGNLQLLSFVSSNSAIEPRLAADTRTFGGVPANLIR